MSILRSCACIGALISICIVRKCEVVNSVWLIDSLISFDSLSVAPPADSRRSRISMHCNSWSRECNSCCSMRLACNAEECDDWESSFPSSFPTPPLFFYHPFFLSSLRGILPPLLLGIPSLREFIDSSLSLLSARSPLPFDGTLCSLCHRR